MAAAKRGRRLRAYIYEILLECSQPLTEIGHMSKVGTGSKYKMQDGGHFKLLHKT